MNPKLQAILSHQEPKGVFRVKYRLIPPPAEMIVLASNPNTAHEQLMDMVLMKHPGTRWQLLGIELLGKLTHPS